jgi:hypothetical protein
MPLPLSATSRVLVAEVEDLGFWEVGGGILSSILSDLTFLDSKYPSGNPILEAFS